MGDWELTKTKASDVFGEDWQSILDELRGDPFDRSEKVELPGATYSNIESVPIQISAADWVLNTANERYQSKYILRPKFTVADPTQARMDKLPAGTATYYRESVQDIDAEEDIWYKLYYPLSDGMHPSFELVSRTSTNLASSDTSDYIEEHGNESNTMNQKISKVGGFVSDFRYSIGESAAMQKKFGCPVDTIESYINSVVDEMTLELLTTSVKYGYTFRKIFEGDLDISQASHSIFGDEIVENITVDSSMGISMTEMSARQVTFDDAVEVSLSEAGIYDALPDPTGEY